MTGRLVAKVVPVTGGARGLGRVDGAAAAAEGAESFMADTRDRALGAIAQQQALRRNLEADDVTGTVVHLLFDQARHVTARTVMVDGAVST